MSEIKKVKNPPVLSSSTSSEVQQQATPSTITFSDDVVTSIIESTLSTTTQTSIASSSSSRRRRRRRKRRRPSVIHNYVEGGVTNLENFFDIIVAVAIHAVTETKWGNWLWSTIRIYWIFDLWYSCVIFANLSNMYNARRTGIKDHIISFFVMTIWILLIKACQNRGKVTTSQCFLPCPSCILRSHLCLRAFSFFLLWNCGSSIKKRQRYCNNNCLRWAFHGGNRDYKAD